MPELPEVETLKRELAQAVVGKKIKRFESARFGELDLLGKRIEKVERRAKILIFELRAESRKLTAKSCLLVHLKMTGQLIFKPKAGKPIIGGHPQENPFKYTRAVFTFSDGSQLFFNDLRKFGWLKLVSEAELAKTFERSGVEPLSKDFTLAKFKDLLARCPKRKLKPFLLDQTLISGLGNIYVDESCFRAGVLPTRIVRSLTSNNTAELHRAIIEVLKLAVQKKGTSAKNYVRANGTRGGFVPHLNVYGRAKQVCKKCRTAMISKIKFAGRGTHFCAKCQR